MSYGRNGVLAGEALILRVVLTDETGAFLAPDAVPSLYIYDDSVDLDTVDSEVDAETYASALAGPLTPTLISPGFYEYTYTIPNGSEAGVWRDVWVATVNTVDIAQVLQFTVLEQVDISYQLVKNNELIIIELSKEIANEDGETLGEDVQISFLTKLTPFYASPDMLRMEVGRYIDFLPDTTLALLIHWSSKEADFISQWAPNSNNLKFAKSRFTVFDGAVRSLMLPGGASGNQGAGGRKQLGDLLIDSKGVAASAGVSKDIYDYIQSQRKEWWRVVNAGGTIVPGEGFGPQTAVKGKYDPDRRIPGRRWADQEEVLYVQPTTNGKQLRPSGNRMEFVFNGRKSYND